MTVKRIPMVLWLFLFGRVLMILTLNLEGLRGFGDVGHFYQLGLIDGWPYFHYWVEFPPIFPFLIEILYRLSGGVEHVFDYLLVFVLTVADAGVLLLFNRLAVRLYGAESAKPRVMGYLVLLLTLAYGWWYFDPLAVLALMAALNLMIDQKPKRLGLAIGIGALIKLFPLLVLPAIWRRWPWRKALRTTLIAVGLLIVVYGALWLAAPQFTQASLASQGSKGSWETVWALVDGNDQSGLFGPEWERLDPTFAYIMRRNPPVIPVWLTLMVFGAVGLWGWWRVHPRTDRQVLALVGFTWSLFYLWSPGWSVQWVLYLLPLVILLLPKRLAALLTVALVLVNVLEWPLLLSRGAVWTLILTIPLRTLLFVLLAFLFYKQAAGVRLAVE
jgi:hypothetical protein